MSTTTPQPTPETDALAVVCYGEGGIEASHGFRAVPIKDCRKLERERDEAREDTPWHSNGETKDEWFARQREKYAVIERERDEARDQLKFMRDELQKVCQQRDAWAMRCDKLGITAMEEAIKEAHEALDNCVEFINDAHIIEAQWHWMPVKQSKAALTKLQPFIKLTHTA